MFKFKNNFYSGCRDPKVGKILKDVIQTDYFRVSVVDDVEAVEVCGALKVCSLIILIVYIYFIHAKNIFMCILEYRGCWSWFC